jgi:hypothetical protein
MEIFVVGVHLPKKIISPSKYEIRTYLIFSKFMPVRLVSMA